MEQSKTIRALLLEQQDTGYQQFMCRLLPTLAPETILGVRTPALRRLARQLRSTPLAEHFLQQLPHQYYEENNLHGILICQQKGYAETVQALNRFLPYVNNWATCDLIRPNAFQAHPPELIGEIRHWLNSESPYTVRFGLEMLLRFYLDDFFDPAYLDWAASCCCGEYYIDMMVAWYFATALAKQPVPAFAVLQKQTLSPWVHNKTIQKGVESRCLSPAQKDILRTMRRKKYTEYACRQ